MYICIYEELNPYRISTMGLAAYLAVITGIYVNGHQLFEKSPKDAIAAYVNAGYSPVQAFGRR